MIFEYFIKIDECIIQIKNNVIIKNVLKYIVHRFLFYNKHVNQFENIIKYSQNL